MSIYSLRLTPIGKTTQKQPFTAAAHVGYITRKEAASHVMAERMPESRSRAQRWLKAEERADRVNARVADKMVIALPRELALQQQVELVYRFAETLTQGKASWLAAIHAKGKDRANPHCHLLVRDRCVQTGQRVVMFSAGPKEIKQRAAKGLSVPTTLRDIRAMWERLTNAALEAAGRVERIDRRSLAAQGLTRPPQVHEGPNARAMHARGFRPVSRERVYRNRAIRPRHVPPTRLVDYRGIDRGLTRLEYNARLHTTQRTGTAERSQGVAVAAYQTYWTQRIAAALVGKGSRTVPAAGSLALPRKPASHDLREFGKPPPEPPVIPSGAISAGVVSPQGAGEPSGRGGLSPTQGLVHKLTAARAVETPPSATQSLRQTRATGQHEAPEPSATRTLAPALGASTARRESPSPTHGLVRKHGLAAKPQPPLRSGGTRGR
jgi:hypothetical protein